MKHMTPVTCQNCRHVRYIICVFPKCADIGEIFCFVL